MTGYGDAGGWPVSYLIHVPNLWVNCLGALNSAPNTTRVAPDWLVFLVSAIVMERDISEPVGRVTPDDVYESLMFNLEMFITAKTDLGKSGRDHKDGPIHPPDVIDKALLEGVETDQLTYLWECICSIMIALDMAGIPQETPLRLVGIQGDCIAVAPRT